MRAIMIMFDSLNRHLLAPYGCKDTITPNFDRLAKKTTVFDNFYSGSLPCMPARRELHTGRYNFLHRAWGPLEGYDDSMVKMLSDHGIYTHLTTDHWHYWEEGGGQYWNQYNTYEFARGQEGDHWKGIIDHEAPAHIDGRKDFCGRQEYINREYMQDEENQAIAVTFNNGLEFIEKNKNSDNWFLQIEAFDPHEPFFTQQKYKDLYPHEYSGPEFDWPGYHPVRETKEQIAECRYNYYALLSQCDAYLGKVLDMMDVQDMWKDTMLIVNTDHGFLLSEHGWWGKLIMPYWNEISHIPFFIHDPRRNTDGQRRSSLMQTIDIAPTLLDFFGLEKTKDMEGYNIANVLDDDKSVREYALFGQFGLHVNITDGHYVYMRAPRKEYKDTITNYMLEPHSYPDAVDVETLKTRCEGRKFSFSKGVKIPAYQGGWFVRSLRNFPPEDIYDNGDLLYDIDSDPSQLKAIHDPIVEDRMKRAMVDLMSKNDAPEDLFTRLGFVDEGLYPRG